MSHKAGIRSLGDIHSPSPSLLTTELEPPPSGKWLKNEVTWTSNPSTWNPLNLSVLVQFGDNDRDLVWVHWGLENIYKTLGTASDTGRSPRLEFQAGLYFQTSNKDWETSPDKLPLRSAPLPKGRKVKPRLTFEKLPSWHSHHQSRGNRKKERPKGTSKNGRTACRCGGSVPARL